MHVHMTSQGAFEKLRGKAFLCRSIVVAVFAFDRYSLACQETKVITSRFVTVRYIALLQSCCLLLACLVLQRAPNADLAANRLLLRDFLAFQCQNITENHI